MSEQTILMRNQLALSSFDPQFSSTLSNISATNQVQYLQSKTEHLIPALRFNETLIPLHSRYDPIREGEKLLQNYPANGYLVFLGLGAGYHILPFLKCREVSHILIIDKDLALFRSIIENIDLRALIIDHRVRFLIDLTPEEIKNFILKNYIPSIYGNLRSIPLYSRLNTELEYFQAVVDSIKEIISRVADDYTVQSQFGKKWFSNTIMNLQAAERTTCLLKPYKKILVTGAGPSLEMQIDSIKKNKKDGFLIATDTSLPALLNFDIIPDCVISIDCQQISYHHFIRGLPANTPLVLDLASPPILTRLTDKVIFFSSGHPFSHYVTNNWRMFPAIDTSGGNVSHAAVSLANTLGAEQIFLYGLDFSYPEGKSYVRDTYQYYYFRTYEDRMHPLQALFFTSIFKNKKVIKEQAEDYFRYTTKPMINYKERLEDAIAHMNADVIHVPGKGLPLITKHEHSGRSAVVRKIFAQGPAYTSWKDFLKDYLEKVRSLKEPYFPVIKYLNDLSNTERDIWTTQYPAAASLREYAFKDDSESSALLKATREWTMAHIEELLANS